MPICHAYLNYWKKNAFWALKIFASEFSITPASQVQKSMQQRLENGNGGVYGNDYGHGNGSMESMLYPDITETLREQRIIIFGSDFCCLCHFNHQWSGMHKIKINAWLEEGARKLNAANAVFWSVVLSKWSLYFMICPLSTLSRIFSVTLSC